MQSVPNLPPKNAAASSGTALGGGPGVKAARFPGGANAAEASLPGGEVWETNGEGLTDGQTNPDLAFTGAPDGGLRASPAKIWLYVLLFLVMTVVGFSAYALLIAEQNPLDYVASFMGDSQAPPAETTATSDTEPETAPGKDKKTQGRAGAAKSGSAAKPAAAPVAVKMVAGNPYWALPNSIVGGNLPLTRTWTQDEEESLRAGTTHRYSYQRYKTVSDIRSRRLRGSDAVLWDALQDKKFWTRMQAAVGLGEFNVQVSLEAFTAVIAHARSELIASYLERFVPHPSAAQAFVARQLVRLMDERGRLVALRAIDRSGDALRELYLAAATKDPGPKVQTWITQVLRQRPIAPARYAALMAAVTGDAAMPEELAVPAGGALPSSSAALPRQSSKVAAKHGVRTPRSGGITTEEDIDEESDSKANTGGDVEFYDTGAVANDADKPDPATFEYKDIKTR